MVTVLLYKKSLYGLAWMEGPEIRDVTNMIVFTLMQKLYLKPFSNFSEIDVFAKINAIIPTAKVKPSRQIKNVN